MGCDIHIQAERRVGDHWEIIPGVEPFTHRSYGVFGFLADVRNYSEVQPIAYQRGLPSDAVDADEGSLGDHSYSWLSVAELVDFDYDAMTEDRRCTRMVKMGDYTIRSGGETCDPGEGEKMTFRQFLGEGFFEDLEELRRSGAERVVFGFDG